MNKLKNIKATIQARMGSSRLPGKTLMTICGKPLILWQIERLKRSKYINNIIVCTSNKPSDDILADFCETNNIEYFRGPENDVLRRVSQTILSHKIDINVEFTGDSPIPDTDIVDEQIRIFLEKENEIDFLSNAINTSYPPGQDVVVYKSKILLDVNDYLDINDPLREHVSYNITRFPKKYRIYSTKAPVKYNYPNIHLEVDTLEDFKFIENIINYFVKINKHDFNLDEVLDYINKNPSLLKLNSNVHRKWKSLRGES
ncbi:glycosyltransferase family protein [bacterium]|nr:glycosyltransferase family protein [bacterium]